jgi:biopolymer transport protein TolQ
VIQLLFAVASEDLVTPPAVDTGPAMGQHNVIDLVFGSGPVVQASLVVLAIASVVTWGIIVTKWFHLRTAKGQTDRFSKIFWTSRNLAQISEASEQLLASPVATVYAAGHSELTKVVKSQDRDTHTGDFGDIETIERALKRAKAQELTRLETGTTFLATTASAAPFIGLFGTVWGVMNAFIGLSSAKSSSIQAVAPGISEALISTAIGLAAAIPASIAYNYFNQQIRVFSRQMDMFSAEFLNIARRHFL